MGCCKSRSAYDGGASVVAKEVTVDFVVPAAAAGPPRPATIAQPAAATTLAMASAAAVRQDGRPAAGPNSNPQQLIVHGVPVDLQAVGSQPSRSAADSRPGPSAAPAPGPSSSAASRDGQRAQKRVVRIFVSSTFQDMQAERDAIRSFVNPTLKAMCAERGLFFHCVDLRWGINEKACTGGEVVLLCLREVHRSTHFVGLLKARYGWRLQPEAPAGNADNALFRLNLERAADEFPWIRHWEDRSVTEIEMRSGVLGGAMRPGGIPPPPSLQAMRDRTLFYVAGPALMRDARLAAGGGGGGAGGEGPYAERRLEELKAEVRAARLPVAEYADAQRLALDLRDALSAMIEREHPLAKQRPWLEAERAQHEAFAASRQRVFVRNAEDMGALSAYAAASGPEILVLHGEGGCGKSALLANWALEWGASHPADLTVVHFIGGSQSGALLPPIAWRISEEVRGRWPGADLEKVDPRGTDAEVAARLSTFLADGAARWPGRVLLVLDGLDQLQGDPAVRALAWLPPAAGPRLRILVSSLPGPTLEAARARPHVARAAAPLSEARRRALVEGVLKEQGRALSDERLERIVRADACRNALFLTVLLDELSSVSVHANLDADIAALLGCGGEPRDLFRAVLRRLASRHGAGLVRDVASAIACARHGMAEDELKAFVGVDAAGGPRAVDWSLFWHDFLALVVCRDGPYAFFHRCTAEAAELESGLAPPGRQSAEQRAAVHARLGEFFAAQEPSQRRAEEGPWALARAGPAWSERLAELLCDEDVLERLEEYEMVGLWLASGRADEAAPRLGRALESGGPGAKAAALGHAGSLLHTMGRVNEGIPFLQESLELLRRELGPDHADVTAAMQNLAILLKAQGDTEAARPLYEEALRAYRKTLGPEHPHVLMTMQNLAGLHLDDGDFPAARALYEEALRLRRKTLGPEHPDVATTSQNLANLLQRQGDYAAARPMYEEALRIRKRALGPEHPMVATTMHNFAVLLKTVDDYDGARQLLEEALRLRRGALGREHPDVATTMTALANVLQAQGEYAAARPLYEEALGICKRALGPEHAEVARTLMNFGVLLKEQGDFDGARPLYEEALRLRERALGGGHPDTAWAAFCIADLLAARGEHAQAIPFLRGSLEVLEGTLGPQHPRSNTVRRALQDAEQRAQARM